MSVHIFENWSPNEILRAINDGEFGTEKHRICSGYKSYTYIVCGKPGPTGKSWLYHSLFECGYKAVELSEDMASLVNYNDDKNHVIINGVDKFVLIILNKPLVRK